MKTSFIFGTRPEAIKLAPVILALRAQPEMECRICVTAQHREMLDQVLSVFGIVPDTDLDLMRPNQTLGDFTARSVKTLDRYLADEKPDLLLIQGDTTTVLCAALAAFYQHVLVGHVEAGLRTGDLNAPWPEEANRALTSRLAQLHFAPTPRARDNLMRENIPAENIFVTGNTVIDALLTAVSKIHDEPPTIPELADVLQLVDAGGRRLVLITGHRRENFGTGFENICRAIAELARRFPEVDFVYPVHLNPRVRRPVNDILGASVQTGGNIHLVDPLSYLPFVALMEKSTLILTDSGGIQEEAPSLGKPVLVMRDVTERPEAVEAGTVLLVGTDCERIIAETTKLLSDPEAYDMMSRKHNPYGDGKAAERIVKECKRFLM